MKYKVDLHNHSCLSPCASLEMSPTLLVERAVSKNIDILALTDHNSTRNLPAFAACCEKNSVTPIFGLEVNTFEEVHVVCLFEELDTAVSFGNYIESTLPNIHNDPNVFGDQIIVDEYENILGSVEPILFSSSSLSFFELIPRVLELGGLVIPAHIERFINGAVSQLGFLPDLPYSAVESLSVPCIYETYNNAVITGSDAHIPSSIGSRSFYITEKTSPSFTSLVLALQEKKIRYR
ncbi:MAG: PHP domain-containing protein [Bacteroidetes bacterium]|nr:PHP domain-containing protein [Bacteroidota bacterium]